MYCARCGVAPYCSVACQRRDWRDRHRDVCHNLARLSSMEDEDESVRMPCAAPLRQPRAVRDPAPSVNEYSEPDAPRSGHGDGSDQKKFVPPSQDSSSHPGYKSTPRTGNRPDNHGDNRLNKRGENRNDNRGENRNDNRGENRNDNRGENRNDNRGENRNDNRGAYRKSNVGDNRNDNRAENRNDNRGENRNDNRGSYRKSNVGENRIDNRGDDRNKNFRPAGSFNSGGYYKNRDYSQRNPNNDYVYRSNGHYANNDENWDAAPPKQDPTPKPAQNQAPAPFKKPPQPAAPTTAPAAPEPKKPDVKPPLNVADVTPAKKIVPKNCVIETLSPNSVVLLSVECSGEACRSSGGLVCLALHDSVQEQYEALCDKYAADCYADSVMYKPNPGDVFSYFDPSDSAWYRARCVSTNAAVLIDAGRLVTIAPQDKCVALPASYETTPEFCCLLTADNVKVGDSLQCTLVTKTPRGFTVTIENVETGASVGNGELSRWLPKVEYPPPKPAQATPVAVSRPPLSGACPALLVDAPAAERVFVRPATAAAQRAFDDALQEVVLYARTATPLIESPLKGQLVISKFTDDLHYRAVVLRTKVSEDKYQIEYVEFGNIHISKLCDLYACPPHLDLTNKPPVTSHAKLQVAEPCKFTPDAQAYLDKLKDEMIPLVLTLTSGEQTAPSGAEVVLTVEQSKESVNRKVQEMCSPDWKKIEERGGDVVETEHIMFDELEYAELPTGPCEIQIIDTSFLHYGILSGYQRGLPHAQYVLTTLTEKMGDYCNSALGREPYLPKEQELCIAKCPPYPQWFRGVLAESAAGSGCARVCYVDYGNIEEVPLHLLRKMLAEFVRGLPALANTIEIKGFPEKPTEKQIALAMELMQVDDEGIGILRVTKCSKKEDRGDYVVDAPDLIAKIYST